MPPQIEIAPPCLQCDRPVPPARPGGVSKRGPRLIDGITWRWFCSRQCSGVYSGRRNAASGLLARNLFPAAEARYKALVARRRQHFQEEADSLRRYGVPRDVAVSLLDRVFQMGVKSGRDRAMARIGKVAA